MKDELEEAISAYRHDRSEGAAKELREVMRQLYRRDFVADASTANAVSGRYESAALFASEEVVETHLSLARHAMKSGYVASANLHLKAARAILLDCGWLSSKRLLAAESRIEAVEEKARRIAKQNLAKKGSESREKRAP